MVVLKEQTVINNIINIDFVNDLCYVDINPRKTVVGIAIPQSRFEGAKKVTQAETKRKKFTKTTKPKKLGDAQSDALKHFMLIWDNIGPFRFSRVEVLPLENLGGGKVKVEMVGHFAELPTSAEFTLVKQGGKWIPSDNECLILYKDWSVRISYDEEIQCYMILRHHPSGYQETMSIFTMTTEWKKR